jgi:hypothetical protein
VTMLFNSDSAIQSVSRRFCTVYKSEKSDPLQSSGRPTVKKFPLNRNFKQITQRM